MKLMLKLGGIVVAGCLLWLAITENAEVSPPLVIPGTPEVQDNSGRLLEQLKQARNEQDSALATEIQALKGADKEVLAKKLQARDKEGNTPLLVAVYRDFIGVVPQILSALQESGVDMRHQHNFRYNTALHLARTKPMIDLLIPAMAIVLQEALKEPDVLQNKPEENNPLFLARTPAIAESLESAAWPLHVHDVANNKNQTPLMFVVSTQNLDYTPMEGVEIMPPPASSDETQKRKEAEDRIRAQVATNFIEDAIKNPIKMVKISGEDTPFFAVKDLDGNTVFHLLAKSNLDPALITELIQAIKKNYGDNNDTLNAMLADKNNAQQTARDIAEASSNRDKLGDVINSLSYK